MLSCPRFAGSSTDFMSASRSEQREHFTGEFRSAAISNAGMDGVYFWRK